MKAAAGAVMKISGVDLAVLPLALLLQRRGLVLGSRGLGPGSLAVAGSAGFCTMAFLHNAKEKLGGEG